MMYRVMNRMMHRMVDRVMHGMMNRMMHGRMVFLRAGKTAQTDQKGKCKQNLLHDVLFVLVYCFSFS